MKLSEILEKKKHTFSFEYFPPKTEKGIVKQEKVIESLDELNPDFVSVTFGAGGSSKEGSYELAKKLQEKTDSEVLAYLTCYGLSQKEIHNVLSSYQDLGIENILAIRGDIPEDMDSSQIPGDSFSYAYELVNLIKNNYDMCVGVAGYPEGHVEAPSKEKDIEYLKYKVDQGADYVIAQFFYDNDDFFDFLERCHKAGINVPILAGVMPVYSLRMLYMLTEDCGAAIPEKLKKGLSEIPEDDTEALVEFGIEYAAEQCEELLQEGVRGLHIYTMNKSESALGLVRNLRGKGLL